ncbi:MAG: TIGR02449 family protein [Gammaproteobacteria bacterium]
MKKQIEQAAEDGFKSLEQRIDELLQNCERLQKENRLLKEQQQTLSSERSDLMEKNELVRAKVETMISRLKSLEQTA